MSIYPKLWRQRFLQVELGIAIFMTAGLAYWCMYRNGASVLDGIVHGSRAAIYGTLASIFGSLLGFAITTLSVVLGFSGSERLHILRHSKYYSQLWAIFTSAIRVLGMTTIAWLMALFFDREPKVRSWILVICIGASFLAALRIARCVWVLECIVEVLTAKSEPDPCDEKPMLS